MASLRGNAVIGQSGGPTVVINQSLVGCVESLRDFDDVGRIYGAHHAVQGIVREDFIELGDIPQETLERVALSPAAALGSSRDKPDEKYCEKIFDVFAKREVRFFFYIGGNDSSDTCRIINDIGKARGYEMRAFHIPKTIDNDLVLNDHTPGFASAARFVACAFMGDNLDNKALPGVKINVVMGRHAGFLTAASVLARQRDGDGPHLIYVPEVAFDVGRFVADVDRTIHAHGRCVVAVSEGIHDESGTPIATKLAQTVERDAHGNVQLSGSGALADHLAQRVKEHLGKGARVRGDTFGYLQRSFAGCVSEVDQAEARAVGRRAVEAAKSGLTEGSVTIQRVSNDPYRAGYDVVELAAVAGKTRTLPPEHLEGDSDIADSYRDYLNPLVGPLPVIEQL